MRPRRKKISKAQIAAFWRDWDSGKRVRKRLVPYSGDMLWTRKVVAVNRITLGTVRTFSSKQKIMEYCRAMEEVPRELNALKPQLFRIEPVQILDVDTAGQRLLERVYRAPPVFDFIARKRSRYRAVLEKKLAKRGIDQKEATARIKQAYERLRDEGKRLFGLKVDINAANAIVLDIDRRSKRVVFGLVDLWGSQFT